MRGKITGLRFHAYVLSGAFIVLTGLLGTRAYFGAREHALETRSLVNYGIEAQALLVQLEQTLNQIEKAGQKFHITRDPAYAELLSMHEDELATIDRSLADALSPLYPELAARARSARSREAVVALKQAVESRRLTQLRSAEREAGEILRAIALSLMLSMFATAWLIYLFYGELMIPLKRLRHATAQIRRGELAHRLPESRGVAELRELSASFNSMAERLESLEKAKSEFLANISHEIRNPLAALKEGLNLLATQGEALTPLARSRASGACLIASKRLEGIINNLLKLSGGEADLPVSAPSFRSLAPAIQTAIDEVRVLADKKHMMIHFQPPPELDAFFSWDGMVHVFENLLMNAIKYGNENSAIQVAAGRSGEGLELSVTSSGAEVPPNEAEKIFERFYRASNSARKQGLGIGLHVVRKIIEGHQGKVFAESSGPVTRIRILLPLTGGAYA